MNVVPRRQLIQLYDQIAKRRFVERWDELNQSQWFPRKKLEKLQQQRLHKLLTYASQYVPYYQRVFKEVGFHPDEVLSDINSMQKIPYLEKQMVRDYYEDLQTTHPAYQDDLTTLRTSGSTGQPLFFKQDSTFRDYVTADIYRHLEWSGWQLGDPQFYIWGASFEVLSAQAIRTRLMDWVLNRTIWNAFLFDEADMEEFIALVRRRKPYLAFCYTSRLYHLAEYCKAKGYDDIKFDALFTSAEVLYPSQREVIEQQFGCKIFDRYGTRELGGIACECEAHNGSMHVSVEDIILEIEKDDHPAQPGEVGHMFVTNLHNYGMPFIRYRTGDLGSWREDQTCTCGRNLPMMTLEHGRHTDMFPTRTKGLVWSGFVGKLFWIEGIAQFQVIQKKIDLVLVRIVKDDKLGALPQEGLDNIVRNVKEEMGDDVEVKFEFPDEIKVPESGKYRYITSEVDPSEASVATKSTPTAKMS